MNKTTKFYMLLGAWFLLGLLATMAITAYSEEVEKTALISGDSITITITKEQADACRAEGGCILVTALRDQQDESDMKQLLSIAKKCAERQFKEI